MYGFVHRKDIITSMVEAKENSLLSVISGQVLVSTGDYVITNLDGDQFVVSPEYIEAFKQVKIVTNPTMQKKESPFVSEYMKQLQEAPELLQDESELWGK